MAGGGNAESKYGEKRVDEEEDVNMRTVDCLRGRLLAERMASKNANEEADKLGNKMKELEKLLEQEAKSRKRAEKRLNSVMKKLQSLNITNYNASSLPSSSSSSGDDESCFVDNKSEVSCVSSSASSNSTTKENQLLHPQEIARFGRDLVARQQIEMGAKQEENLNSPSIKSGEFEQQFITDEGLLSFDKSSQVGITIQSCSVLSKMDEHRHRDDNSDSNVSSLREEINQEEDGVDESMALVPIFDVQQEVHTIDPQVLDHTVKEVLDALKYAKEQLQRSMEKRQSRPDVGI